MKKILALFMAAAALTVLASCQKEKLENTDNEPAQTVRIISGAFKNGGTKTTLDTDNVTPLWSVGDKIRVLDGTSYQDVTLVANGSTPGTNEGVISADNKSFSFATTLTGTLYAVYPASATTMTKCTDGNITFTVPAIQDGTFASANICVASGDGSTANTIYFSNATAVVEMTVGAGVVYTNLTAANKIAGDMTVAMGSKGAISGSTTTSLSSNYIFVSDTPTGSIFYLAVAPVETGAVTITCNTTSKTGSTNKTTKTLAMDKIYTMNLSGMTIDTEDLTGQHGVLNGQEYVIIKAKYDGTDDSYLKWATCNIGASTPQEYGKFFAYGDVEGQTWNGSSWSGSGFFVFPTYDVDSNNNLKPEYDAAHVLLGSTWRMPTGDNTGELEAMRAITYWAWVGTDNGWYVFKPGVGTLGTAGTYGTIGTDDDKTKALLFFPAAGFGNGTDLKYAVIQGYYGSSTLNSDSTEYTWCLWFDSSDVSPDGGNWRRNGHPVRPVSD